MWNVSPHVISYSPVSHWKDRVLFGQSPPWPYSQDRNLAIAQWFLKSVSVKKELQIIAVSVHGLLQLFILLRAALKTPQMLTLFRGCTEHTNMREWSLTECKFFYWLEAYFCRCHVWGKKKVVNETLKHAKYCREAYQWSIYRLKKNKSGFWIYKTWFPPSALRAHRFVTKPLHSFITNSSLWMLNWLIRLFYPMNEILPLSQIGTPLFFPLIFS